MSSLTENNEFIKQKQEHPVYVKKDIELKKESEPIKEIKKVKKKDSKSNNEQISLF